jgi:hypothetical protein
MENNKSVIEIPSNTVKVNPSTINLNVSTDLILVGGVLLWALCNKLIWPVIKKRVNNVFTPIEEEKKLANILAQIGIITSASRVILAAFHNGALDSTGYHLQELSTVNSYTSPGNSPMNYPIRNLPIGRIMFEIEEMIKEDDWVCVSYHENLPQQCRDHLLKNDLKRMCNRLVKVGNLPIGILSVQYTKTGLPDCSDKDFCASQIIAKEHESLMEELYMQIATIMRRRIVYPSPVHTVFGTLLGTINIKND